MGSRRWSSGSQRDERMRTRWWRDGRLSVAPPKGVNGRNFPVRVAFDGARRSSDHATSGQGPGLSASRTTPRTAPRTPPGRRPNTARTPPERRPDGTRTAPAGSERPRRLLDGRRRTSPSRGGSRRAPGTSTQHSALGTQQSTLRTPTDQQIGRSAGRQCYRGLQGDGPVEQRTADQRTVDQRTSGRPHRTDGPADAAAHRTDVPPLAALVGPAGRPPVRPSPAPGGPPCGWPRSAGRGPVRRPGGCACTGRAARRTPGRRGPTRRSGRAASRRPGR
ncbi:hypothetical protein P3T26_005903 [Streptomyces sp. MAA16]|nr:hypothetical protein [Streptomyces sp. MAA16]